MQVQNVESLSAKQYIIIKGAKMHNLKNIDVAIPRNQFVVITGVSGSGKSTLAIDTLYAEGQRRYVESLSSYARQFLNRMNKPDIDYIKGICPAIAIEQRSGGKSSRSTVGSMTEVYDYLRLLFARIGKTHAPKSGQEVKKDTVTEVVNFTLGLPVKTKLLIVSPIRMVNDEKNTIAYLKQEGFTRIYANGEVFRIDSDKNIPKNHDDLHVVIDRVVVSKTEETQNRLADSIQLAFEHGNGRCSIVEIDGDETKFSNLFEADGMTFEVPTPQFFNFNNSYGACKRCEGFGTIIGVDKDLVFPNKNLSIYEQGIAPWRGEKMKEWNEVLIQNSVHFAFPIHKPIYKLSEEEKELLWTGNEHFEGLNTFFRFLENESYKIQYRVMLARYRGKTNCSDCNGNRIRRDANYVTIKGFTISDFLNFPIYKLQKVFRELSLDDYETTVAKRLLTEINNRLLYLDEVGLNYLSLNRKANTLSGGETQRIHLTRTLGSNLTGSMYILDEPSIGLHPRDSHRLIRVLQRLRNLGNTVIVVEHEEDIIRAADYIIDIGPYAGRFGGDLVFAGTAEELLEADTLTADYLLERKEIPIPEHRRKPFNFIEIHRANKHNLVEANAKIALQALTVVCGVSGSGKTTLIKDVLYPELKRMLDPDLGYSSPFIAKDWKMISQVELVDQNPIGKSSRSNPVTYIKAYDAIRGLFSKQKLSQVRGYQPKHFSFNVEGGRCEECKGEGEVVIEMQFLADVKLICENCNGRRFKQDVLEVKYKGKSIFDVLELTVEEAVEFFKDKRDIFDRILPLLDVGLGYVKLGQSSSTLSGGEAQRVKLASFLSKGKNKETILFIFDEPTTGLHFHDIHKLLSAFQSLIEIGHSIVVIEHNMDVIKTADWLIDIGPEGGDRGGKILYEGKPEGLLNVKESYTGQFLSRYLLKEQKR